MNLAGCYKYGHGIKTNMRTAFKWYRLAAERGDADAQFEMGLGYHDGDEIKKNLKFPPYCFRKSAKQTTGRHNTVWDMP